MKRHWLRLADRFHTIRLFLAEIEHDNSLRTIHQAREELDRAIYFAKHTQGKLETARANARMAGFEVSREERHRALGI